MSRDILFNSAALQWDGGSNALFKVEDIDKVARQLLHQRMVKEMAESLMRVAIKKAAEAAIRKENEGLAVAASIVNMATEQADTRNWQTLPHEIHYTWADIDPSVKKVNLKLASSQFSSYNTTKEINVNIEQNRTKVVTFHSLEVSPRYNPVMDR